MPVHFSVIRHSRKKCWLFTYTDVGNIWVRPWANFPHYMDPTFLHREKNHHGKLIHWPLYQLICQNLLSHHVQGNTTFQVHPWEKPQFRFIQLTNPVKELLILPTTYNSTHDCISSFHVGNHFLCIKSGIKWAT